MRAIIHGGDRRSILEERALHSLCDFTETGGIEKPFPDGRLIGDYNHWQTDLR
jgi:hypothetical protein